MATRIDLIYSLGGKRFLWPAIVEKDEKYYYFSFDYHEGLKNEIKSMQGSRWDKDNKSWKVLRNYRNEVQLAYLVGQNPHIRFDKYLSSPQPYPRHILPPFIADALKSYQHEGIEQFWNLDVALWAYEMGLGKSLMAICAMLLRPGNWLWVVPKIGLPAIQIELTKWRVEKWPTLMTYEQVVKAAKEKSLPRVNGIILDESQKVKNAETLRSQACWELADVMRQRGGNHYIIEMSGTPAPRSPLDWHHQLEILVPGYLKEGDKRSFMNTLAWVKMEDGLLGQKYPKLESWKDDEKKCATCHKEHVGTESHPFIASVNEVARLYKRMAGPVKVKFKKDNLDLPEPVEERVRLPVSQQLKNMARLIARTVTRGADRRMQLRELSDGFIYKDVATGETIDCPACGGSGLPNVEGSPNCDACKGSGKKDVLSRATIRTDTPKDGLLNDTLEEHEDIGRLIVYCGFQASVDRCIDIVLKRKWSYIKIDGRGWSTNIPGNLTQQQLINAFQQPVDDPFHVGGIEQICIVANPISGGATLTLTASPTEFFYSLCDDGSAHSQAKGRIHRISSTGARYIYAIHLPSDELILNALEAKRDLELITLGEFEKCLE